MFTRKELIDIRDRAEECAYGDGTARLWRAAYERLAQAADHIDAMMSRCEIPHPNEEEKPKE